jgi:hypothetical protein
MLNHVIYVMIFFEKRNKKNLRTQIKRDNREMMNNFFGICNHQQPNKLYINTYQQPN